MLYFFSLSNFNIQEVRCDNLDALFDYLLNHSRCKYTSLNGFVLWSDGGWVIYHESKDKINELIELYRLTGCNMEYYDDKKTLRFRYKTCIDLVKLMDTI